MPAAQPASSSGFFFSAQHRFTGKRCPTLPKEFGKGKMAWKRGCIDTVIIIEQAISYSMFILVCVP